MEKNKSNADPGNRDLELYELYLEKIKETDEISFKLMGMVPLLSGVGIYTLFTQNSIEVAGKVIAIPEKIFWITGFFGAMITFLIYRWELRNISICGKFRDKVIELEGNLD